MGSLFVFARPQKKHILGCCLAFYLSCLTLAPALPLMPTSAWMQSILSMGFSTCFAGCFSFHQTQLPFCQLSLKTSLHRLALSLSDSRKAFEGKALCLLVGAPCNLVLWSPPILAQVLQYGAPIGHQREPIPVGMRWPHCSGGLAKSARLVALPN